MSAICLNTLTELAAFGRRLGQLAQPADIICLDGDLGAGKTTLTQAIAQGLSVPAAECVSSPSFALLHEYQGRLPLYHMDFYRLTDRADIEDAGLDEYFFRAGVTVLEWCERAGDLIPATRLKITITIGAEGSRLLFCDPGVGSWRQRWPLIVSQF